MVKGHFISLHLTEHFTEMANPYISLLRAAWLYAWKERKRYVFVYAMFVVSAIITALFPLLLGWFIN